MGRSREVYCHISCSKLQLHCFPVAAPHAGVGSHAEASPSKLYVDSQGSCILSSGVRTRLSLLIFRCWFLMFYWMQTICCKKLQKTADCRPHDHYYTPRYPAAPPYAVSSTGKSPRVDILSSKQGPVFRARYLLGAGV